MTKLKAISLALLCALLVSTATVFQKFAGERLPELITNWPILAAVFFYFLGLLFLVYALKHAEVTTIYPLVAVSYIISTLYALLIFQETITIFRWLGVLFIFLGVTLIGVGKK